MMRSVFMVLAAISLFTTAAFADTKTLETLTAAGEGDVEIVRADYIEARNNAKEMAIQKALWKVVEQLLPPQEFTQRYDQIQSAVVARSGDFTQKYKFIDEMILPDNATYHVSMEVTFFAEPLRSALEGLGTAVSHRRRVLVVIDERAIDGMSDANFLMTGSMTEDRLRQAAGEAGFKGMARAEVRALGNDAEAAKAVQGDADAVRWMAEQLKADYVITGTARAAATGAGIQGTTRLNVWARDGNVLWTKEVSETSGGTGGPDRFKVIRLCADKAAAMVSEFLVSSK